MTNPLASPATPSRRVERYPERFHGLICRPFTPGHPAMSAVPGFLASMAQPRPRARVQ